MFEGLKKKFSSFIGSLGKKEEEKAEEASEKESHATAPAEEASKAGNPKVAETTPDKPMSLKERKMGYSSNSKKEEPMTKTAEIARESEFAKETDAKSPAKEERAINAARERPNAPKVTAKTRIKGIIFRKVRITENDISPFMEELNSSLLQSDVNYDVAEKIMARMRESLVGKEVGSSGAEEEIAAAIRSSLLSVLGKRAGTDIVEMAKASIHGGEGPFRILFIGPNGAGKTTTMAKVAKLMLSGGLSCVLSASDTFRAAAIEQTAYHAERLGIGVIKGRYGADPASVAFDAISHAKAHGIDVVLIDSAGRQETNKSLMEEVKKMVRVTKPNLKIFVGESITGNSLLSQVSEFNAAVGLDGVILTKLDCDAKGGNTLSILGETDVPVLYFGTGEGYSDLMAYDPEFIVGNIVPNN
jgi:fused signal recognition particle receptor